MTTAIKFQRQAAGHYIHTATGVEIVRGESGCWFAYAALDRDGKGSRPASRATLAHAKVAASAMIADALALIETAHDEAIAEADERDAVVSIDHRMADRCTATSWGTPHTFENAPIELNPEGYDEWERCERSASDPMHFSVDRDHATALAAESLATRIRAEYGSGKGIGDRDDFLTDPGGYIAYLDLCDDDTVAELAIEIIRAEVPVIVIDPSVPEQIDAIRYARSIGQVTLPEALREVRKLTGCTFSGACVLISAPSTAALADA